MRHNLGMDSRGPCPIGLRAARSTAAKRWTTKIDLADRLESARLRLMETLNEGVSLDELADTAHLSRAHFVTSFRKQFGSSPLTYRAEARYAAAHALIIQTQIPIQAIRLRVGISAPSTFARDFKKRFGASPSELRKMRTP